MRRLEREYDDLQEIGHGGFGIVFRARCIAKDKPWYDTDVAVKKIDIKRAPSFRVKLELQALSKLIHDNIVKFYDAFQENGAQYIIMEYCKYRSLREYVRTNGKMSDFSAAYVLRQLVSAVKYIHEQNMIHRDLSAGNVLISSVREDKLFIKLADFGLATNFRKGDVAKTMLGTPGYIAPQVYNRHYNQKADVYSLGGILYLMLTGEDPPRNREINPFKDDISLEGATLIQSMMDPHEERRIGLGDISMSDFMRKVDGLSLPMSRSRDLSREKTPYRNSNNTHHSPVARTHSNRPPVNGYKYITNDSAFESGESARPYHGRSSSDRYRNGPPRVMDCRHSNYNNNQCIKIHYRISNVSEPNNVGATVRDIIPHYASPKNIKENLDDNTNKLSSALTWPINVSRLGLSVIVRKTGRFIFNENGTIVYEATVRHRSQSVSRNSNLSDESLIKWIAIIDRAVNGTQVFSTYQPACKCVIPNKDMPLLPCNPTTCRTYSSKEQLLRTKDKVDDIALALYRKILDEVSLAGARVVKIMFKPSSNTTARLMENGDFRVKFQDGRLALLKKNANSISVTSSDKAPEVLSSGAIFFLIDFFLPLYFSGEKRMFECAHTDALLLETFLESVSFQIVKPFPFHFSSSRFCSIIYSLVCVVYPLAERNFFPQSLAGLTNQLPSKNYGSLDHLPKQYRAPLRDRNISSLPKAENGIRMLTEGEYILRGQLENGVQIPTRIISNGLKTPLELRISSTDPRIFVFKEGSEEMR
ncbi:unnamed protein product [Thelazia callipaeda]|uniref:Protein kinase domain-containing protein n=1 Tax=Thelazia callipaeda TaxID=103827 RepID=A0A0N5CXE0_THECL|nr:unnamed protein product [Thelazia callipaeda]